MLILDDSMYLITVHCYCSLSAMIPLVLSWFCLQLCAGITNSRREGTGITQGSGPLGSGLFGPDSGFSVMPKSNIP